MCIQEAPIQLALDIGGSKTLLGLCSRPRDSAGAMPVLQTRTIATPKSSADLLAAIRRFLDDLAPDVRPTHACFAIAGPIDAMRRMGSVTNIESLDIDAAAFGEALDMRVSLLNDLGAAASAYAAGHDELGGLALCDGRGTMDTRNRPGGHGLVIGVGTGLGLASFKIDELTAKTTSPVGGVADTRSSEGGHACAAPRSIEDRELVESLGGGPAGSLVSFEDLLSGPGLERVYGELASSIEGAAVGMKAHDIVAALGANADSSADSPTKRAATSSVQFFSRTLGAFARDSALMLDARSITIFGGVVAGVLANPHARAVLGDQFPVGFQAPYSRVVISQLIADVTCSAQPGRLCVLMGSALAALASAEVV